MDDDEDFMYDDEYSFDFGSDGASEVQDESFVLENTYFTAKSEKASNPKDAIQMFETLLELDIEKTLWSFKALKQLSKVYLSLGDLEKSLSTLKSVLNYSSKEVKPFQIENYVLNLVDKLENYPKISPSAIYKFFLNFFPTSQIFYIKLVIKHCNFLLKERDFIHAEELISNLSSCFEFKDLETNNSSLMLELYGILLLIYSETGQNIKLELVYQDCLRLKSAVPNLKINGLICECGGKMYMNSENWDRAHVEFFESFKCYHDAGSNRRLDILKFANDPKVAWVKQLVSTYLSNNYEQFCSIFKANVENGDNDHFIRKYLNQINDSMKQKTLVLYIKPYSRVSLFFLSQKLKCDLQTIINMLHVAILEGNLAGRIDERENTYVHTPIEMSTVYKDKILQEYVEILEKINRYKF
ncbi:hypothetical protein BB560_002824 [Smittium megazygosporum]|uniref:PCI domain-containing protein n=1 Tax=Smittium megazygosporum TaxID=133381 RepID=A0A2T9ZDM9_9FUNG|nr:hypothetical protein BB560_002824 [Smittium megazygosporum]